LSQAQQELHHLAKSVLEWAVPTADGFILDDAGYQRLLQELSHLRDEPDLPWAIESLQRLAYALSQQASHILAHALVEVTRTVERLASGAPGDDPALADRRRRQASLLGTASRTGPPAPGPRPPGLQPRGVRASSFRTPRTFR
jgi:hypothetical protein